MRGIRNLSGLAGASLKDAGGGSPVDIIGFDLTYARNDTNGINATVNDEARKGIYVSPDGINCLVTQDRGTTCYLYHFTLAIPHDVYSAVYVWSMSLVGNIDSVFGVHAKPDGTRIFLADSADKRVYAYDLSVGWDLSTAVRNIDVERSFGGYLNSINFSPDGTKAYLIHQTGGGSGYGTEQYSLSTPWDLTTGTKDGNTNVAGWDFDFIEDGNAVFFLASSYIVYRYELSTAYDILSIVQPASSQFDVDGSANPINSVYGIVVPPSGYHVALTGRYQTFSKVQVAYTVANEMIFQVIEGGAE